MNAILERDTLAQLHRVLGAAHLPDKARADGQRLLERLRAPVRLVVAGPAGSGKTHLAGLLAGCPPRPAAPGPSGDAPETPSLVFRNLVVIEYALPAPGSGICGAVGLEVTSPDIILWCTQGFTHDEAQVWARVPDNLKDHAFLVLTKADELLRLGVLQDRLDDLCEVVETEFHSLLPIATRQAMAARDGARITDPALHGRSGAGALFEALGRMIEQGRSADLDAAQLFVRRYGGALAAAGSPPPAPVFADSAPAMPVPPAAPAPMAAAAPPAPRPACRDTEISARALRLLDDLRDDFPDEIGPDDPAEISALLGLCARTAEALDEMVTGAPGVSDDLSEDVMEANETMVLLTLEDDENAAADAVTLLLQLRRGFETRLAA
ncbi:hypothetical protein [Rhodovulum marinum]|uniref:Dynamin family protein n=1 Tax=Rhodovulum marinum TaxID=320662 RepID=A0A4R2Q6C4_9RHOB|nr:hypothetical protein [Rhodovulum marinum]TCP44240.1 hypothetical protein EV662_101331 [Rhodovulum marinum]